MWVKKITFIVNVHEYVIFQSFSALKDKSVEDSFPLFPPLQYSDVDDNN